MAPRAAVFSTLFLLGCFPPGEGVSPPLDEVYFPVGLALDGGGEHLFIVNSDFDLQYNAGTVLSWDLAALRSHLPPSCVGEADCDAVCGAFGRRSNENQVLYPGRCGYIDPLRPQDGGARIQADAVEIGAFATDVIFRARPAWADATSAGGAGGADGVGAGGAEATSDPSEGRLFIPVRGDATLHWIDVSKGELHCGQPRGGACNGKHRSGDNSDEENTRRAKLSPEPFGIDADEEARSVVVTNQTSGAVGLFTFSRGWGEGPQLSFSLTGLPSRPMGVAALPLPLAVPAQALDYQPGYLVTFRNAGAVYLVRVYDDAKANPARPYAKAVQSQAILANSSGIDSRGIAVDGSLRETEERACRERFGVDEACARDATCASVQDPGYQTCVATAGAIPLDVFIANRTPSSLLVGRTRSVISDLGQSDLPAFQATLPVSLGATRVVKGDITNESGERERRVFTICFDSRRIAVYDPVRQRMETEIVTGRGPQAVAIDAEHALAYVAHFTDSYIGVVDLDQRHPLSYGAMIATIGKPRPPRASK